MCVWMSIFTREIVGRFCETPIKWRRRQTAYSDFIGCGFSTFLPHFLHVGRALRRMRHIWRNEERLSLAHDVINNAIPLADAHFDVALELVEILFRIDQMKVIPRVGTLNDHHEKIASVIKITVANWWLELFSVLFD